MTNVRLAYFTHDSISEGVGRSQILSLCTKLSNAGVRVSLFTFEKIPPTSEVRELIANSSIDWKWFPFENGGSFPAFMRIQILRSVQGEFDIIHARGDLPAFAAVLRHKEPVLWDIRSLWADQRGILNPRRFHLLTREIIKVLTKFTSKHVSAYNILTNAADPIIRSRFPNLPRNHSIVSTCVDTDLFAFHANLPSSPLGLLSGTYNAIYDSELLKLFNRYMVENFGHKILWVRGKEGAPVAQDLGQQEMCSALYGDMPDFIRNSSYGLSVCKNNLGDSLAAAMPTKIAEFLSVGRPVVVNSRLGDVDNLLVKNGVAVKLDHEKDIPKAANEIIELLRDPQVSMRCRNVAERYFSLDFAERTYRSMYQSMISN